MPEISIIVPVYKVENYLRRCVDSILVQTFTDFELILVDDGSPDNSPAICDEYAKKDSRIAVIHKENGGVSSARNRGLDAARGRYIMFCDSDDCVHSQWCKSLIDAIRQFPASWINCNVVNIDEQGNMVSCATYDAGSSRYMQKSFYELYSMSISGALWNKIYCAEIIREHGVRFNEQYKIGEDTDFNMQYYKYCDSIVFLPIPLYYYYRNNESAVNLYRFDCFDQYRHTFFDRLPYIENEFLDEYLDNWLWRFLKMLEEVHDLRNTMKFGSKIRYGQKMMQTPEFLFCAEHAPGKKESPLFMRVIRTHNYYLYWLFQKLCAVRNKLFRR